MDTPARLLRLLAMMSARGSWRAAELADRLEITERTVRRDITRLRDLGYPIEATTGPYGGYSLGAGGRLPPLLLDDEEAVAIAVALHAVARHSADDVVDAALSALTKLGQVMPATLRDRVAALGEVAIGLPGRAGTGADAAGPETLMTLALACRRSERIRFDYRSADGTETMRHVEPYRLVSVGHRWYLVANDVDRADWRTFRVDRVDRVQATGARFAIVDPPDVATFVAEGIAVGGYDGSSELRVHAPVDVVRHDVAVTIGVCTPDPDDPSATRVRIGGDADWVARYAAGLPYRFEVIETQAVRDELRVLGQRLVAEFS